ncbi:MIP family channel protein [Nocardioides lianchengensis]|uniref:Aquaporin Z n=1 Tax=Nocardioides lianchengensis TaxID=1045774 RepID=A0A1G6IV57_9ACTN|nr:MIP family channel protein [Nocardioides lianchengensis]NYG12939.1 aquaporin Z [Nocardioides lianchengensis]SDC10291.1 aquaporin Z [Nocardioides lianchengensis]
MTEAVVEAPPAPTTLQKIVAEVLGTFVLVFFGCGSVVYAGMRETFDILAIALTFGLAVLVMAYAVGRISGGHFNPAVSVAAAIGGRIAWREVPIYVGAQLAGAIAAGGALLGLLQGFEVYDVDRFGLGQNSFGDDGSGYSLWAALILELLLTAIFVFVILAVTDARNEHPALAPLVIGFTLTAIHLVAIPATGTSVNPARSIGPALFAGTDAIQQVWLFIVAPLLGAVIAGLAYPAVFGHAGEPVPGSGFRFPERTAAAAVPGYGASDQYQQQWNQQVWSGEPIIQDGWQWDPYAQQWIPAPQPGAAPPAPPAAPAAPAAPTGPVTPGQPAPPDTDEGHTQIRPPQV